jgi:hypothetical protein
MKDRDNQKGEIKRVRRLSLKAILCAKCGNSRGLHLGREGLQQLADHDSREDFNVGV